MGRTPVLASLSMTRPIFTFETTHHALWAEEIARDARLPHEVIPAPPEAHAKCNIALETLPEFVGSLETALTDAEVPYGIYEPPS